MKKIDLLDMLVDPCFEQFAILGWDVMQYNEESAGYDYCPNDKSEMQKPA
jgi:hypothetical protein